MQAKFFSIRTVCCLSAILFFSQHAAAQPNLTQAGNFQIGQSASYLVTSDTTLKPGVEGENITWDFSQLPDAGAGAKPLSVTVVAPGQTPYATQFGTAGVAEKYSNNVYNFFKISQSASDQVGFVDENAGLVITYPNPWRNHARPLAFGDALTDTLTRTYTNVGLSFIGTGVSELSADAYGTLLLPGGTYSDVLRTVIRQVNFDTALIGVVRVEYTSYRWYRPGDVFPLLRMDFEKITSPFFNQMVQNTFYQPNPLSGVKSAFRVKPLDCQVIVRPRHLILRGDFPANQAMVFELFDAEGRNLSETALPTVIGNEFVIYHKLRGLVFCRLRTEYGAPQVWTGKAILF